MLRSARRTAFLAIWWVLYAQPANNDTRSDDYIARAKQFFRVLYPGLDRNLRAVITDDHRLHEPYNLNSFNIELHDLELKPGVGPTACWCSAPALSARFVFDWQTEAKELVIMAAGGTVLNGRTDKFIEELKRHPAWSDTQVIAALDEAGARFGPNHKSEFLRVLPIRELKPFTGELELISVEFYLSELDLDGKRSKVAPSWFVRAKWHGPGDLEEDCNLIFEPFEGRLMSFLRL